MAADISDYVGRCEVCKETKAPNYTLRPPMGDAIITERPWQHIYTDLLGPYPRSKSGNSHILIVDQFSKYVLLKPLRKAITKPINSFLEKEVFHIFGVPESLMSDNGAQFISKEMKEMLDQYGVRRMGSLHLSYRFMNRRVPPRIISCLITIR